MSRVFFIALCLLGFAMPTHAQQQGLPDFGEGNAVPLSQEYLMGRAWLMQFRRQAPLVSDPQLQDYIESLVYRLAETSQLRERRLEIVLVNNKTINAFAVPGGVVGVHTGLILSAENESQLASVLGHELAHLSQRHFSRGMENAQRSQKMAMVGLLTGLVAAAAGAGDAGMAAMAGSQAAAQDASLRYSRQHEQEADRIGMQNLVAAGLDPHGSAGMFEIMQAQSRVYGSRPPEFLLTHPLTEKRIADARNRAAQYPRRMYQDNPEFQLMRARADLSFIDDSAEAVSHFRKLRKESHGAQAVAAQYGLVLALTENGEYEEARALLQPMREFKPDNLAYALAETEIDLEQERYDEAIRKLRRGLEIMPGNHPVTIQLGKTYFKAGRYTEADKLLKEHARRKPTNATLWYWLAEIQGLAGDRLGLHQSRAEYFFLNGAMQPAMEQLTLAVKLAKDEVTVERIEQRMAFFQAVGKALGQF
ncbi:M48 family metallopeptidase [Pseudohalioglobus sediminis]|uniref:Putative beta-barrel assembly-enhancing protease n=1 Tax=Pseudohalioglobus sediminis TaxID=2606449 RepID=A0A5B0WSX3_9GAMM|nr:M48 family metalloprotease [Pseudohalioglobus sediminis]KAA1189588.1 M48 family metallopeptidase [Pseudohalioglobus sediminis]